MNLFTDPDNTREAILAATYRTLQEHGYADLTIEKIGSSFEKSTSLIYHHFDGKDDLVLATLEHVLESYEQLMIDDGIDAPEQRLNDILDWYFGPIDDDHPTFSTLFELRARAAHDDAYQRLFHRSDRVFKRYFTAVIQHGIDQGTFHECDPEQIAEMVVLTTAGVTLRRSLENDGQWLEQTREEMEWYLRERLAPEQSLTSP